MTKTTIVKDDEIIEIYDMIDIQFHEKDCKITTRSTTERFIFLNGTYEIKINEESCMITVDNKCNITFEPETQEFRESINFSECVNNINKKCVICNKPCSEIIKCNIKLRRIYPGKYKWLETCYTCKFKKTDNEKTIRRSPSGTCYNGGHVLHCTNPARDELKCTIKKSDIPKRKHSIPNSSPGHVPCNGYAHQ